MMTMFTPKTVEAALAPLTKIQTGLQAVSEARKDAAENKRAQARNLMASARADDSEHIQADVILAKLTTLLTVKPEDLEALNIEPKE